MYKFNTELSCEDKRDTLSLASDDSRRTRNSSTASSVISSLPGDSDVVLEDCFEMLAQLAPEALVSASLSKRYCIAFTHTYISASCHITGLTNVQKKISNAFMMKWSTSRHFLTSLRLYVMSYVVLHAFVLAHLLCLEKSVLLSELDTFYCYLSFCNTWLLISSKCFTDITRYIHDIKFDM